MPTSVVSAEIGPRAKSRGPCSRPWVASVAAILVSGACTAPVLPPERLISAGESVARRNCGTCHAMGAEDASLLADAPPFRTLRPRYSRSAMAQVVQQRLEVIHPRMPKLALDEDQIDEFLDYWQGLAAAP